MAGLPPRSSPDFQQAVIARYALEYASKGWNAAVTVDDEFVPVVAIPENGIDPKKYVIGLLQHRYLEDALPILEALYGMLDDADIAYNYGICLSELGRIDESVTPLERCVHLDHEYTNAYVGLWVSPTPGSAETKMQAFARKTFLAILRCPGTSHVGENRDAKRRARPNLQDGSRALHVDRVAYRG